MVTAVRLTVVTGPHKGRKFCFCGPTRCQAGRALDCFVDFSGTERDNLISRYHCQMDIDPPSVQVYDLGSRNGTYVNGMKVVHSLGEFVDVPNPAKPGSTVAHGDMITIGGTTLRVDVLDCPHADRELNGKRVWEPGESTKKDCPLPC